MFRSLSDFIRHTPLTRAAVVLLLACAVWSASVLPASAGPQGSGDTIEVVTEQWAPYTTVDGSTISGAMTEVIRAALAAAGMRGNIQAVEWSKAFGKARDHKGVLIYSILRRPDREKRFAWIGPVMEAPLEYVLFRSKKKKVTAESVEQVKKLRTALMLSEALGQAMLKAGFSHRSNMLSCTSEKQCVKAVLNSRADLYARPAGQGRTPPEGMALVGDFDLPDAWLYAAFSFNTPKKTIRRVRTGLDLIMQDGTVKRIMDKYNLK